MPALVLAARSLAMPRQWAQQSQLLERQHDRLEALLDDLIDRHAIADACRSLQQLALDQRDCQLLLRKLGLHLRLEERWLSQLHSLCGGDPGRRGLDRGRKLTGSAPALADGFAGVVPPAPPWCRCDRLSPRRGQRQAPGQSQDRGQHQDPGQGPILSGWPSPGQLVSLP